ncbi:hypothetical protein F5887DRAFT_919344 [Amanita rubescens]|nr:hypothetical protein F5887DRAFT_919344 [Amanita rubescens]
MSPSRRVKAVRTRSSKRIRRTTPSTSLASPADWVWSALHIARRAAMADDIAHIPCIQDMANIFTRMLEQLQEMTRNMDDFEVITNEIGVLIESVVQYAREREPMSQRFVGVCNGILSSISSMQSEMEEIIGSIGGLHTRSAKAKIQGFLSSYQLRVKCLRSDLQLLSSTGILSNATGFTISHAISDNHGNLQINSNGMTDMLADHLDADQMSTGRADELDMSHFRKIKFGDLKAVNNRWTRTRRELMWNDENYEKGQPVAQEFTVRMGGEFKTARMYVGEDALQSFKNDVGIILRQKFRQVLLSSSSSLIRTLALIDNFRHPHIIELFGVCLSDKVPTLIFHGDLRRVNDDKHLGVRDALHRKFRLCREWQVGNNTSPNRCFDAYHFEVARRYLKEKYHDQIILDDDYVVPIKIFRTNYSLHGYVDSFQHLKVSIESPVESNNWDPAYFDPPRVTSSELKAIEDGLSDGTIRDRSQSDKKKFLLAIYDHMFWDFQSVSPPFRKPTTLISPMRRAGAVRLTFDREYHFKWGHWQVHPHGLNVEMSYVTIENSSWTRSDRYALVAMIWCSGYFSPTLPLQAPEVVFLFVQDPQDVDDVFEIAWFWTKDPKGSERLSEGDMGAFGLCKVRSSKIYVDAQASRRSRLWEELRIYHETFGFGADSPAIPRLLDLPVASVEWDGSRKRFCEKQVKTAWFRIQQDGTGFKRFYTIAMSDLVKISAQLISKPFVTQSMHLPLENCLDESVKSMLKRFIFIFVSRVLPLCEYDLLAARFPFVLALWESGGRGFLGNIDLTVVVQSSSEAGVRVLLAEVVYKTPGSQKTRGDDDDCYRRERAVLLISVVWPGVSASRGIEAL